VPATSENHPARLPFGELRLSFEENIGQANSEAKFVARGAGANLFLSSTELLVVLEKESTLPHRGQAGLHGPRVVEATPSSTSRRWFRMRFAGGAGSPSPVGLEPLPGKANYLIGNDSTKWRTGVPTYRKVSYANVYPGVDVVYYGKGAGIEYDVVVAPGAEPAVIRVAFEGIDSLALDGEGDLILQVQGQTLKHRRPSIYQSVNGEVRKVEGGYVLASANEVGFRLGEYDRSQSLVIDPILVYSTYLGGSGFETGRAIAVDRLGNAYLAGETSSLDFPTVNPLQATLRGEGNLFIAKLNPSGSELVYSTYLGSFGGDTPYSIAVDGSGNAYVTGATGYDRFPPGFPMVNPAQGVYGGGRFDAFVAKLNEDGSALVYSTYLGGRGEDAGTGIAVDASGNAYVTGGTTSDNFPTVRALQPTWGGGICGGPGHPCSDAFITKLSPTGSFVYSTYLGGSSHDQGLAIAVDNSRNAYVTGQTRSANFPTLNPFQPALGRECPDCYNAFISKVNPSGTALVYSTYLGGTGADWGYGIAIDESGNSYVTGVTASPDFPTAKPFQSTLGGSYDVFVAKLNEAGSGLVYSTYLGGSAREWSPRIALDDLGNAYVTGSTDSSIPGYDESSDFPMVDAIQPARPAQLVGFVSRLSSDGSALVYSTYLGGSDCIFPQYCNDAKNIAVDGSGNAYVIGWTEASNFPTAHPLQPERRSWISAFITKIGSGIPGLESIDPNFGPTEGGTLTTLTGTNFLPGAAVSFGGAAAKMESVVSTTTLTAMTPAHEPGTVDVVLTNPDGETAILASGFTYADSPSGGTKGRSNAGAAASVGSADRVAGLSGSGRMPPGGSGSSEKFAVGCDSSASPFRPELVLLGMLASLFQRSGVRAAATCSRSSRNLSSGHAP
jgi:hypothetical protein